MTVRRAVEGEEDSGRTTEGVAMITTTITATEEEVPTEVVTIPQATEVATIMATVPLGTTPQVIAIRAMAQVVVEGNLGEAEVSCGSQDVDCMHMLDLDCIRACDTPNMADSSCQSQAPAQVGDEAGAELPAEAHCIFLILMISSF